MMHGVRTRRATTALIALMGTLAFDASVASAKSVVNAATATAAATCTAPALVQPFAAAGDTNSYAPLPGESWDSLSATGWTLTGGAKVVTTTLADGTTGRVLDLPAGATAVSPAICLTSDYPSARGQIRSLSGNAGLTATVTYLTTNQRSGGLLSGTGSGWTLSRPLNLNPSSIPGWQLAQLTLTTAGPGEYQVSNLYVDPKMRH